MVFTLMRAGAVVLALGLATDGLFNEGDGTSLPVSPQGGMTVLQPTEQDNLAFTDAGLVWAPTPMETSVLDLDGGAPAESPDAGAIAPACAPIAAQIAHRRVYLRGVEQKSVEVGWERGAQEYCAMHPGDTECARPPIVVERELSELIQNDPSEPVPEADGWIVRWSRALKSCETSQETLRKKRR